MAATLTSLIAKFNPRLVREAIYAAIDINEREWVLHQIEQLSLGIGHSGASISRVGANYYPYAPLTVRYKKQLFGLAAVVDRVTLYDQGNYYAGLQMERKGDVLETFSRDSKMAELEIFYPGHLGLAPETKSEYIQDNFLPSLINELGL